MNRASSIIINLYILRQLVPLLNSITIDILFDKAKPVVRQGRKTTGLTKDSRVA